MILKPDGKIDLDHRAYFLRGTPHKSIVTVASEDGYLSVISADLKTTRTTRLGLKIGAVSPHPAGSCLAWVHGDSGSLIVQGLAGESLHAIPPPHIQGASRLVKQGFDDCYFDESGEFLWLVAPCNDQSCEVRLIETRGWSLIDKVVIEDKFGASSCSFQATGKSEIVSLWMAAGQDGQAVYWLERTPNGFTCVWEKQHINTIPPVFSPDGSHFLVVNENFAICKFHSSTITQAGMPLLSEDEDNPFAESLAYIDQRNALASTNEGRIFAIDVDRMRIEDEVAVEGHEPRPIGDYYPTLKNEMRVGTDISHFMKLGNVIFFVFRRDRGTGLTGWKDSLLWWSGSG